MPEKKTLNEELFYKGSSANLPCLHTCENKPRFGIKVKFFMSQSPLLQGPLWHEVVAPDKALSMG